MNGCGNIHACVIPTERGEIIGDYEVKNGRANGALDSKKYDFHGTDIVYINGEWRLICHKKAIQSVDGGVMIGAC